MELLQQAFIFLAAGVIAVPIASRLGLGSVLGYLIAGTLIGPFALGFLNDPEHIMHFAEFGVVMMLFLIGLELQPSLLWRMRGPILGLGGLQMLITTLIIAAVALMLGLAWKTALAIGLILSLSSTAIALQILAEKNLMKSNSGRSGFAVLLFQDIAVIPIIAILPLLAVGTEVMHTTDDHGGSAIAHLPGWQQTLIVISVVAAIILLGRFLTRPLFRLIAASQLREIFTAAALLLVIGIALLMNSVGLSPALGAFIAGVVLADSEYRHELEANIDPFKALLLGLFFISVGASIDFILLSEKPLSIGSIVLSLVLVKFAILWILARSFQISGGDRYWFSFALAQGGEFGFVLLSFSLQNAVLEKQTVDLLTASIALSMILTPVLILLNEKLIQPRFQTLEDDSEMDPMEDQDNPVIIAGFGRFGQIVARLLSANGHSVTVLDHSATHIERVRRFGYKVFYGDASREDLLHTAGIHQARLLVIAIDDREKTQSIIESVKRHCPDLTIYARAFDVIHYHQLHALGVDHIEREMFLGSLKVAEKSLQHLGMRAFQARRQVLRFAQHDQQTIDELGQHMADQKRYVSEAKIAQQEVIKLLQDDQQTFEENDDHAWDSIGHD